MDSPLPSIGMTTVAVPQARLVALVQAVGACCPLHQSRTRSARCAPGLLPSAKNGGNSVSESQKMAIC